jgi:hypothetical protein
LIDGTAARASKRRFKSGGGKKTQEDSVPGFQSASEALRNVFSDCIFAKMAHEEFVQEVNRLLQQCDVDVHTDEAHTNARRPRVA